MKNNILTSYLKKICLTLFLSFTNINTLYAQEFIIGVEEVSYFPLFDFSATDPNRPSFSKDLLTAFFEQHDYPYRFIALPIKRFNKWYIEEGIDFKFPDNVKWRDDTSDELNITFSQPVLKLIAGSYVHKSNADYKPDDIKKLATIFGFSVTHWSDKLESKELELIEEHSPIAIVKHVLHGNVDATDIDSNVIRHNLQLIKKPNNIVLNTNIKHNVFNYHLSSIKHPKVIKQFNEFLLNNQSFIKSLKQKYDIREAF